MKTAIITGASGGIGISLVETMVRNGYFVFAQYNNNQQSLIDLKDKLASENLSDYIFMVQCDLTSSQNVLSFFSKVSSSFKKIDLLINNAGIDLYRLCEETSSNELDELFSINFNSAYNLTKHVIPLMRNSENASIINVSSVWGINGACMETAYSASKSALVGFTKALAKELAPNIRVNCITPGVINTKMNSCFNTLEMQDIVSKIPLKRLGEPKEVASLCEFLASEKAKYITGAVINIDGGYSL